MAPRLRLLLLLACLAGCTWSSGADCPKACSIAASCPGLHETYNLSCSSLSGLCFGETEACAACLTRSGLTCDDLIDGGCREVCLAVPPDAGDGGGVDGGPDGGS